MKSISAKLFKVYASFFGLFFSALLLFYIIYVGSQINQNIIQTQEQSIKNTNQGIEYFFTKMDDFAITLVNSREFTSISTKDLPRYYSEYGNTGNYFNDLYRIAYQMISNGYKIGVLTKNNQYIWMGNNYFISDVTQDFTGLTDRFSSLNEVNINVINNNEMIKQSLDNYPYNVSEIGKMVSVSRIIMQENTFNTPIGILDIQVPYDKLDELVAGFDSSNQSAIRNVSIYTDIGNKIYGDIVTDETLFLKKDGITTGKFISNGMIISVSEIMSGNLYVVSEISQNTLYSRLLNYAVISIIIFIILNIILISITYKISDHIMDPVKEICRGIEQMKFGSLENIDKFHVNTDIAEIDVLGKTIESMQIKLADSIEEIVVLQSYEIQSKMLALQAQMQPHFLYNTLMTISAMAEEEGNNNVSKICGNLTEMLRYISSANNQKVSISEEIKYLEHYNKIIYERFPKIKIEQDIELEMYSIQVPKLIIQPLVENAIKYCGKEKAIIKVSGKVENDQWEITVEDNGIGFTQEKIDEIMLKCQEYSLDYRKVSLNINGMGLINIYIRLKMNYGIKSIFIIKNKEAQGCSITIGGAV